MTATPGELRDSRQAALFDASDFAEDPQAYARVSMATVAHAARLISTAYSAKEVADLLGVNESRVRQRRLARTLWAIETGDGWVFPALQFQDVVGKRRQIRHLDRVLPALPADLHPVAVAGFLTTAQSNLRVSDRAVSPVEWLAGGGDVDAVLTAVDAADWAGR